MQIDPLIGNAVGDYHVVGWRHCFLLKPSILIEDRRRSVERFGDGFLSTQRRAGFVRVQDRDALSGNPFSTKTSRSQ